MQPSKDDVVHILTGLNRMKAVLLLSEINLLLALDRFRNEFRQTQELQGFLIANFIDEELLSTLKNRYGRERMDVRQCFHRWQILTLLKWAILHCQANGGADPDEDQLARYSLGRAAVMTNDLLMTRGAEDAISPSRLPEKRALHSSCKSDRPSN